MRLVNALAICAGLLLSGCQTVQHTTPSGKAETTIANTTTDQVKAEIVNGMMTAGYIIRQDTPYALSFDKQLQDFGAMFVYGSQYDSFPSSRVSFAIAQVGSNVRIVSDVAVITNPGSAFERRTATNNSTDGAQVQAMLDGLKRRLNPSADERVLSQKNIYIGVSAVSPQRAMQLGQKCTNHAPSQPGLCIVEVSPGSPAAKAGVSKGDVLISVNNKPMLIEPDLPSAMAPLSAGAAVPISYLKKGKTTTASVTIAQRPPEI